MTTKMKVFLGTLLLLLISLSLSLIAAEWGFRYYKTYINPEPTSGMVVAMYKRLPHSSGMRYAFDEEMNFQYKSHVAYNNWAFRFSKDYSTQKEPGEYRIAVFGDSYTDSLPNDFSWVEKFAQDIENDQALKKALGATKITVANFGNAGSGVIFMANQLHTITRLFKPDLAIHAFIDEDFDRLAMSETEHYANTVDEVVASAAVPNGNFIPIKEAPGFELERSGAGISRMVYYSGNDKGVISEKATLKKVHQAMIYHRVHNGNILMWQEAKKIWARYYPSAQRIDPTSKDKTDRELYFSYFEKAISLGRADAPNLLFLNLPTYYETINQWSRKKEPKPFVYWPDFFRRRADAPLISLRDHLPQHASYDERESWFVLPWDGHPSNAGATLYGKTAARLVAQHLMGSDRNVTVTRATIEKELARYARYVQMQHDEQEALALLESSRIASKHKQLDRALELITAAIKKSDDVGAPGGIYQERANIWMQKGQPQKAFDDLTRAIAKDANPEFLKARLQVAITLKNTAATQRDLKALEKLGKKDAAIQKFVEEIKTQQR